MATNHLRSVPGRKAKPNAAGVAAPEVFNGEELKAGLAQAGIILDQVPCAAALWSRDRRFCVFNDAFRQLLGFCEHDLGQATSMWMDRIHPEDRERVATAWNKLQNGGPKISCGYRFLPKHRTQEIQLRELSFSYCLREKETPAIWSFYTEDLNVDGSADKEAGAIRKIRDLLIGLTHEIGNHLQAIRGELDLLTLSGALPQQSSKSVAFGVQQIHKLTREITEYLSPPPLQLRAEDLAVVLAEVIRISERELAEHGIRMTVVVKEPLPRLQLDGQFRSALKRVLEFSCALLPEGGELKIEAGLHWMEGDRYVELSLINASPIYLNVPSNDVFRPFLKVNDCRVGLSMAVARQILRRHFGKIAFRQEHRDRGVFSILIKVPSDNGFLQETS